MSVVVAPLDAARAPRPEPACDESSSVFRRSRTVPMVGGRRSLSVLLQLCLRLLCVLVVILQSSLHDYFLAAHHGSHWAAWILADIVVLALFLSALVLSFLYFRMIRKGFHSTHVLLAQDSPVQKYMGELPLGYIVWGVYSAVMVSKLIIIFKTIAPFLEENELFGPNMMKMSIALSAVVFLLLVMCSSDAAPFTERRAYIDKLITCSTLDIVDTVEFLEILFTAESRLILPFNLGNSILAFGCINLLLPTIALVALSHTRFSHGRLAKIVKLVHTCLFLLLIDIPFLIIRIFLWSRHQSDISSFAIKNAIMILLAIREIWALLSEHEVKESEEIGEDGWKRSKNRNQNEEMHEMEADVHVQTALKNDEVIVERA